MVTWILDRSGRFPRRPHYKHAELDGECAAIVSGFLHRHRGTVSFPLSTGDLTLLVESYCSDVDHYADLSAEGDDVEGMTEFLPKVAPRVSISASLAGDARRENRLRTTLAHELGHVCLHGPLFAERFLTAGLFDARDQESRTVCKRDTILGAREEVDWMEWQAGYASGAILMPATVLRPRIAEFCAGRGIPTAVHTLAAEARDMEQITMEAFQVSRDAARVRLLQLGYLTTSPRPPSLFA